MPGLNGFVFPINALFMAEPERPVPECWLIAVGHDEDAGPLVRRTDFCRREQTRRRRVTHAPKVSQDGLEAEGDVAGDIFEENPLGAAFGDDAGDLWPEMPGIIGTTAFSRSAEGLARIPGEDGIERPAEGPGIEGSQIIPDRRRGEIPCALGCDEDGAGPVLPFDEGAGVVSGFGQHEAQIKTSAACAEGQSVPGTRHHTIHRTPRIRRRSGVTRPRASIASREVLLIVLGGR